ncbi:DNA-methyltransferase [Sphingobacterium spiritivorum]|uniref:DNA-methyltransferase n=1 Tax=Sphingobacterium spiritivorum TaxID=258 RepID=UPI003DA5D9E5
MFKALNEILGIGNNKKEFTLFEESIGLENGQFKYYVDNNILPTNSELLKIQNLYNVKVEDIKIQQGIYDYKLKFKLANIEVPKLDSTVPISKFKTNLGELYQGDCLNVMRSIPDNSVDLVFADPPFNLNKEYKSGINDNLLHDEYLFWCEEWLEECVRILKYGGSLFIWNIPKWNTYISNFLNHRLLFRNWIANDIKFSLPISGKLYPSHYSLLYYTKGKPKTFHPDRLALETCRKCYNEIKDYGGYKNKLNPSGISLTDVWYDIPPVRHSKYKRREGANELSVKLLDRIIEMSSEENDLIFDPFGGSGTTYAVAELKNRRWIGVEIGPVDEIVDRFNNLEQDKDLLQKYQDNTNVLFPAKIKKERIKRNLWTDDDFK